MNKICNDVYETASGANKPVQGVSYVENTVDNFSGFGDSLGKVSSFLGIIKDAVLLIQAAVAEADDFAMDRYNLTRLTGSAEAGKALEIAMTTAATRNSIKYEDFAPLVTNLMRFNKENFDSDGEEAIALVDAYMRAVQIDWQDPAELERAMAQFDSILKSSDGVLSTNDLELLIGERDILEKLFPNVEDITLKDFFNVMTGSTAQELLGDDTYSKIPVLGAGVGNQWANIDRSSMSLMGWMIDGWWDNENEVIENDQVMNKSLSDVVLINDNDDAILFPGLDTEFFGISPELTEMMENAKKQTESVSDLDESASNLATASTELDQTVSQTLPQLTDVVASELLIESMTVEYMPTNNVTVETPASTVNVNVEGNITDDEYVNKIVMAVTDALLQDNKVTTNFAV